MRVGPLTSSTKRRVGSIWAERRLAAAEHHNALARSKHRARRKLVTDRAAASRRVVDLDTVEVQGSTGDIAYLDELVNWDFAAENYEGDRAAA